MAPDGTIYAAAFDGKLHALSPEGKQAWRFQAGREIKSSPAIADDRTIYFGCRDHAFYALTPGGRLKWKFATGAWVDSSPAIAADGTIYFGSWDKNFYALKPDGSLKWKFSVGGIVYSSPAIAADGTIYFGAHNKKFYALDAGGNLRWTFLTGAEITSSPAIGSDGSVYFSSTDGNLYRLNGGRQRTMALPHWRRLGWFARAGGEWQCHHSRRQFQFCMAVQKSDDFPDVRIGRMSVSLLNSLAQPLAPLKKPGSLRGLDQLSEDIAHVWFIASRRSSSGFLNLARMGNEY